MEKNLNYRGYDVYIFADVEDENCVIVISKDGQQIKAKSTDFVSMSNCEYIARTMIDQIA